MKVCWDTAQCGLLEVITSETSVNFYQTRRRNIPEYCHLYTGRRKNVKSHYANLYCYQNIKSVENSRFWKTAVTQLVKKFSAFHENRKSMTMFTSAPIQSKPD
jgi:hypothetical protein